MPWLTVELSLPRSSPRMLFFLCFLLFLSWLLSAGYGAMLVILSVYFVWERKSKVAEDNLEVLIVGAGISGINIAKRLNDIGVMNYKILEQGGGIGGTWYWNKYPGCACDVPAVLYSFSWYHNPAWSKKYPEADEIQVIFISCPFDSFSYISPFRNTW